jgi:hypothetical protein
MTRLGAVARTRFLRRHKVIYRSTGLTCRCGWTPQGVRGHAAAVAALQHMRDQIAVAS